MSAKASHAVTSRYALALIELAQESNRIQQVERDLNELGAMIAASADLTTVISSPSLSRDQQAKAIMAIADKAKFDGLTRNFLGVLVKNRRLGAVQGITEAFRTELSRRRGEVAVEVQTAQDMSASQFEALQRAIAKGLGRDVALKAKVEPSILGGMIVTIGSKMIDDSVARKLERLKAAMSRQSNQNVQTVKEVG
ncbi:MAG TPA: F0F1 ATP synthase subunit delta [Alphaproteobacteria bacterium]|nr:F0F1 ATP synthase subunit delta [Micavibrio sp.]MBK9562747.1 F0F1 ATP synthase subunit delta [Micavibrio sp.]HQX26567.1 F0F1 ATP synthase subunit delta [Alphaproteobacteria bacterium]